MDISVTSFDSGKTNLSSPPLPLSPALNPSANLCPPNARFNGASLQLGPTQPHYGDPFPLRAGIGCSTHFYMLESAQSLLLENDIDHSIAACFLYRAKDRNPAIIQFKLAELYGGNASGYPILTISYIIALLEYLDRNRVLNELLLWSVTADIQLWWWNRDEGWNDAPPGFKVYLEVRNYPLTLWHPTFFHLLVSDFRLLLYVDKVNSIGNDRSTLRIAISCVDPAQIPYTLILIYGGRWRRCTVSVLGWSHLGDPPDDDQGGSWLGGLQTNVRWPKDSHSLNLQQKQEVRASLQEARESVLRVECNRLAGNGHAWASQPLPSPWFMCSNHVLDPGENQGPKQKKKPLCVLISESDLQLHQKKVRSYPVINGSHMLQTMQLSLCYALKHCKSTRQPMQPSQANSQKIQQPIYLQSCLNLPSNISNPQQPKCQM